MIVKQTKHFDGQIIWFTYESTLPANVMQLAPNARIIVEPSLEQS